jgi:copper resistance protein B
MNTRTSFFGLLTLIGLFTFFVPVQTVSAQEEGGHQFHDRPDTAIAPSRYPADYRSPARKPASGNEIRKYAVDDTGLGATNFGVAPVHDDPIFFTFRSDRLELRSSDETAEDVYLWDLQAWMGRNDWKLYFETEGERENGADEVESGQIEVLYGEPVTPFWDARVGVRQTMEPDPARTFGVVGFTGIAPQWFETETNFLVGESDDIRADLELEYNLLLSQRLIFQPRLETQFSFQEQPELDLGDGFTDVELGGRLRYEFHRKFAPYVGVSWESSLGETQNIVERGGGDPDAFFAVVGLRFWY